MAGAALVPGRSGSPPLDGLARMTDSQEALALALDDEMPSFYEGLYQGEFPEQLITLKPGEEPEMAIQEPVGSTVSEPAESGAAQLAQLDSSEEAVELAANQPEEKQLPEEQLLVTQAALDQLRQDISEATAKIEQLIERTAKVESEIGLLRKTITSSRNRISRLWQRRRRRKDE